MTDGKRNGRPCPCGSGERYGQCCGRYHRGAAAPTAEALMRSRYTAYALGLADYLSATWHPSTRPSPLALGSDDRQWVALRVHRAAESGDGATVEFVAVSRQGAHWEYLEETSHFLCEGGRWLYVRGNVNGGVLKPGRNEPCPCGSGRKFKSCCR